MRNTHVLFASTQVLCLAAALAVFPNCQTLYDEVEPVCTQIDVLPHDAILPADGAAWTYIDLAVCHCPDSASSMPCAEADLMPGRKLYLESDRGTLGDLEKFLRTGTGGTTLIASATQEVATISVWTDDGWTETGSVQFFGPMSLSEDSVALGIGQTRAVSVSGAVHPLGEPIETGDVSVNPSYDEGTGLLTIHPTDEVAANVEVTVSLLDAIGQSASLQVAVEPNAQVPGAFTLSAEDTVLVADHGSTTTVTVTVDDVIDGSTVQLCSTMGSFAISTLTLVDGQAQTLFLAGGESGTAVLYATLGEFVSEILLIELHEPPEER